MKTDLATSKSAPIYAEIQQAIHDSAEIPADWADLASYTQYLRQHASSLLVLADRVDPYNSQAVHGGLAPATDASIVTASDNSPDAIIKQLRRSYVDCELRLRRMSAERDQFAAAVQQRQQEFTALLEEMHERASQLDAMEQTAAAQSAEIQKLRDELRGSQRQIESDARQVLQLESAITDRDAHITSLHAAYTEQLNQLETARAQTQAQLTEITTDRDALTRELSSVHRDLQRLTRAVQERDEHIASFQIALADRDRILQENETRISETAARNTALQQELTESQQLATHRETELARLRERMENDTRDLRAGYLVLETQLERMTGEHRAEVEKLRARAEDAESRCEKAMHQLQVVRSLVMGLGENGAESGAVLRTTENTGPKAS